MRSYREVVLVAISCGSLFARPLGAQSLTVIGGTPIQQQLSACIEHVAAGDLQRFPGEDHAMTIVILDHEKFLQVKSSFHADRTRLAFSNLAMRRMYLSSDVFRDMDNALRCIPHELGHFVTHSPYEGNAELAAERIRERAREMCTLPIKPVRPRALVDASLSPPAHPQAQSASHLNALRVRPATPAGQDFSCVGPYSVPECETQTAFLQAVLRKYDAERLGKWSWILIRSEDWKRIVSQLHLDPASPAFSHLGYRQTFFDEALLVLKPKRELELMTKWSISFDQLLDFAVSHELGHAFCQEPDEMKAERYGQRLRNGLTSVCDTKKQHNLLTEIH